MGNVDPKIEDESAKNEVKNAENAEVDVEQIDFVEESSENEQKDENPETIFANMKKLTGNQIPFEKFDKIKDIYGKITFVSEKFLYFIDEKKVQRGLPFTKSLGTMAKLMRLQNGDYFKCSVVGFTKNGDRTYPKVLLNYYCPISRTFYSSKDIAQSPSKN